MANEAEILAVAKRFFDAIESGDVEAVKASYAPNVVIWHNTDQKEETKEDNIKILTNFVANIKDRRYENRRAIAFSDGFVQQHILTGTRHDGVKLTLPACLVCEVKNGQITRLDEYFDSAQVSAWLI